MDRDEKIYWLIRTITYPLSFLPYSWIHKIAQLVGSTAFYFMREYRKRTLSNLALANDLHLNRKQLLFYAKQSFQNLAINCLEYPKFGRETNFSQVIRCENPEIANQIYQQGKGIIFFCGHQSNWEALFLDGTTRMKGIAIGKAIKNKKLYNWILSIREKNGGKIVSPRNAMKEGVKALRKGAFLGIVGDQGMPDSGYSFPFLGRRAWSSTAPALLSYKTDSPIIFASTRRVEGGYQIRYHDPIWPNLTKPLEEEVTRMMDQVLTLLQESIQEAPGEWLWQHNRWKQQTTHNLYKRFRQDCICLILPDLDFETIVPHLPTLKQIYPLAFLALLIPEKYRMEKMIEADEIIYYRDLKETLLDDLRFKLVFNFTNYKPIYRHYERLSALEVVDLKMLEKLSQHHLPKNHTLSDIFLRALCRPGTVWKKE